VAYLVYNFVNSASKILSSAIYSLLVSSLLSESKGCGKEHINAVVACALSSGTVSTPFPKVPLMILAS